MLAAINGASQVICLAVRTASGMWFGTKCHGSPSDFGKNAIQGQFWRYKDGNFFPKSQGKPWNLNIIRLAKQICSFYTDFHKPWHYDCRIMTVGL